VVWPCCRSSRTQAQEKFYKLYLDERLQEVKQGKRPEQVAADRAAFLMDAAMLGANVSRRWEEKKRKTRKEVLGQRAQGDKSEALADTLSAGG
jgi:cytochrome c553